MSKMKTILSLVAVGLVAFTTAAVGSEMQANEQQLFTGWLQARSTMR